MEKIINEFIVNRPINITWPVLTDVQRIAPCMPGAELQEVDGDVFRGVVKVKLGVISTAFKGQASYVERDDLKHRAILKGSGRDAGGKGSAEALITASAFAISGTQTRVVVETELRISGKIAQFGRGIMADVSKQLMSQFSDNLNSMLDIESTGNLLKEKTIEVTPIDLSAVAGRAVAKRVFPLLIGALLAVVTLWIIVR
jgi:carbon monoxide dehydrogenase subunit G